MQIKIGDTIYDSEKEPILLMLDENEKQQIRYMRGQKKYCSFPEDMSLSDVTKFMGDKKFKEQKIESDKKLSSDMVKAIGREMLRTNNVVTEVREITNNFQIVVSYYSNPKSIPMVDQKEYVYAIYFNWKPLCYSSRTLEDTIFVISLLIKYGVLEDRELAMLRYEESIELISNMMAMINTHIKE